MLEDGDCGLAEPVVELGWLPLGRIDDLEKIDGLDRELPTSARECEKTAWLMTIRGMGPVTAMPLQASAPPMEGFAVAKLGLVPPGVHDRRQAEAGQDIE